jgi:hypothetical protein
MIRAATLTFLFLGTVVCFGRPDQGKSPPSLGIIIKPALVLHIAAKETTLTQGQDAKITATISNKGQKPVTLVLPGDGSESGWRTPLIGWSAIKGEMAANHPKTLPLFRGKRFCGNINCLKKEEVFVLAPGQSKKFAEWIGHLELTGPGTFRVVFCYANEPGLEWDGVPLGRHDPDAMRQVQKSHRCFLVSNELRLVVKPK